MNSTWNIGLFSGSAPDQLAPLFRHPVITAEMITDVSAQFVADPFMLYQQDHWYLFFEILPKGEERGVIGLATSQNLADWQYQRVVLRASCHLSYPHLLRSGDDIFMVLETLGRDCISLYRATDFPLQWRFEAPLLHGQHADPTVFRCNDRWWMFTCPCPYEHDRLHLYHADALTGPWQAHSANPLIIDDPTMARPAGAVMYHQGRLFRFAQNCVPVYGSSIRCFNIKELTVRTYREVEVTLPPVFHQANLGWNALGMHHIATHALPSGGYVACVDGHGHGPHPSLAQGNLSQASPSNAET